LHGAYVTVVARKHEAGRKHARSLASLLADAGAADVQVVEPATAKAGAGVVEHFAAGFGVEGFATLAGVIEGSATVAGMVEGEATYGGSEKSGSGCQQARRTLADVERAFRAHHEHGDLVALRAALACYAANMHMAGDPVWLGLVAGSSTGKTETAHALTRCPATITASTLSGEAALRGAGGQREARAVIADAAAGLLAGKPDHPPLVADADEEQDLTRLADFVTMARSPVDRDYQGEIALVLDPEGPYRFVKELAGLWRACGLLGLDHADAWEVALRVARDSLPRLRWKVLKAPTSHGERSTNTAARAG
jgi:hypothetical protein